MAERSEPWRPTATLEVLKVRARILQGIRAFFSARGVLEVETPLLSHAATTDPHIDSFVTRYVGPGAPGGVPLYLHTSPEFAMKRLLAAGSGPIYQLGRVFRQGESGRRHNPEFTLLEWYRPGFDHHALMDEVEALIHTLTEGQWPRTSAERLTYAEAFLRHARIDPHRASLAELDAAARRLGVPEVPGLGDDRDARLDLLLTHAVEPHLGRDGPCFLHNYPASQAALARVRVEDGIALAERFELYLEGVELANGFNELADAAEQRRRFEADREARRARGLPDVPHDEHLLAALAEGLPPCAGVALGVDRLVMLAVGAASLEQVLTFPLERA